MDKDSTTTLARPKRTSVPWFVLIGGVTAVGISLLVGRAQPDSEGVRAALMLLGLLTAGIAVRLRLPQTDWGSTESRLESACLIALGASGALLALQGVRSEWDSAKWFLIALTAVGLTGAVLVLLPSGGRKVALVGLALVHFVGIFSAILSIQLPNGEFAWLPSQVWTRVYRPYLQFVNLNNAYRFYSPEPGPPTLVWFRIQYTDGQYRWVRTATNPADSPTPLHYQRMLALTESVNQINKSAPPLGQYEVDKRFRQGQLLSIPHHPSLRLDHQYLVPKPFSQHMLSAYARYMARKYPHPDDAPDAKVKSIKIYRVVHAIISAKELASGLSPISPTLHYPYYQGKYDVDGKPINDKDPFLFWLIPIIADPDKPNGIHDSLEIHSGDRFAVPLQE